MKTYTLLLILALATLTATQGPICRLVPSIRNSMVDKDANYNAGGHV